MMAISSYRKGKKGIEAVPDPCRLNGLGCQKILLKNEEEKKY